MADERLDVDRVSKRFGDVVARKDMTFDVRAGELFGFLGVPITAGQQPKQRENALATPRYASLRSTKRHHRAVTGTDG